MSRYIDAEPLDRLCILGVPRTSTPFAELLKMIREAPTADIAPVVHGEWIANKDERGYTDTFACSVCDSIVQYAYQVKECDYEYCPHCGARMDGGK